MVSKVPKTLLPNNVVAHWGLLREGFHTSSLNFYDAVETAVTQRRIPDLAVSRVTHRESGILSAKREYLRFVRNNLRFDLCAAPFGTGFFFSWWQVIPPRRFGILFGVLLLLLETLVFVAARRIHYPHLIFFPRFIMMDVVRPALLATVLFFFLCSLGRLGIRVIEDFLLPIPFAGFLYQRFFRPETHFELDTMAMYRAAIHAAVLEVVDGLSTTQGMRALAPDERKPILDFLRH